MQPTFDPINDTDSHRASFRMSTKSTNISNDIDDICDAMEQCYPDLPELVDSNGANFQSQIPTNQTQPPLVPVFNIQQSASPVPMSNTPSQPSIPHAQQ
jgi:hypothetical protein